MKRSLKILFFFLLTVSFLNLKPLSVSANGRVYYCNNLIGYISDAVSKTGLLEMCPQESPMDVIDAMLFNETRCGRIPLIIPDIERCATYRMNIFKRMGRKITEDQARKWCTNEYNLWKNLCERVKRNENQCQTSLDFGVGVAQFRPPTWDYHVRRGDFKKYFGIADYPEPWIDRYGVYGMVIKLAQDNYCSNPWFAVQKYNGLGDPNNTYSKKIQRLLADINKATSTTYQLVEKKIEELREKRRELELQYPEIAGIKPETLEIGIEKYARYLVAFLFSFSGIILLGIVVHSGFLYLTSAGDVERLNEAKRKFLLGFGGMLLMFSLYLLVNYINPQLLRFQLPTYTPTTTRETETPREMNVGEEESKISEEISIGKTIKNGLWEENLVKGITTTLENFETFLNQEIQFSGTSFTRISAVAKYLQSLSEYCACTNLRPICSFPLGPNYPPVGVACLGDPCPDRDIMQDVMNKIRNLTYPTSATSVIFFQNKIKDLKARLGEELRKLSYVEEELINCQREEGISHFIEYSSEVTTHPPIEFGGETLKYFEIFHHYPSESDPITFYCLAGGTVKEKQGKKERISYQNLNCPKELKLGEAINKNRNLAIFLLTKFEELNYWIEKMTRETRNMLELVMECNGGNCKVKCACIPNPCYLQYEVCGSLAQKMCIDVEPTCEVRGGRNDVCNKPEIRKSVEKIKTYEDEIFLTLKELREISSAIKELLDDSKNKTSLSNLRKNFLECVGENVKILNCNEVLGNLGPEGEIEQCHPENFYCCLPSENPPYIIPPEKIPPIYAPPVHRKIFEPLESERGCPRGYACSDEVKTTKQYDDASPPLKEFLACFKEKIDDLKNKRNLGNMARNYNLNINNFLKIVSISDPKLVEKGGKGCSWINGPVGAEGCSHTYQILKEGKKSVSCHYGGTECSSARLSYAVDFSLETPLEKRVVDDIIKAVGKCEPRAWLNLEKDNQILHVSLGQIYGCSCQ
jgi:hypothetical protein